VSSFSPRPGPTEFLGNAPRNSVGARPFSRATVGGNPVGRPATADRPNRTTRALIAAKRYQRSQKRDAPDTRVRATVNAPGELNAFRADAERQRADWMREGAND
jgi:hypothetical protein